MSIKAQGLPMNALVLGALSLLVLIAIATMWVSGGGNIFQGFSQIIGGSTPSTLSNARISCQASCNDLQTALPQWDGVTSLANYKYCKQTWNIEESGVIDATCYDLDGSTSAAEDPIESCVLNGIIITVDSC